MVQFIRLDMGFQLRLALAERLVFNLLGQERYVALDSAQIVSGLGDWFYRDHEETAARARLPRSVSQRSKSSFSEFAGR